MILLNIFWGFNKRKVNWNQMSGRISFEVGTTYEGDDTSFPILTPLIWGANFQAGFTGREAEQKTLGGKGVMSPGNIPFGEVDLTNQGKVIHTLIPDPTEDTVDGEFNYLESRLYGEILVVVIRNEYQGGVFMVDLTKKTQRVYSQLAEGTIVSLIDGGIIILDLWDYGVVNVYDIKTETEYDPYNSFTGDRELKSLVGPQVNWMDDSGDFDWVEWEGSASKNGRVDKGHLIWTDKKYLYDHDLMINSLSVTDATGKTYTMEQIFGQSDRWIDDILSRNHTEKSTDLVNRISAIILVHNATMLISDDNEIVRHPSFSGWATETDDYLSSISPVSKEFVKLPSRFNIIRELIKTVPPIVPSIRIVQ